MASVSTPRYVVRYAYAIVISLFLTALLFQVYLAGRIVFGVEADSGHAGLGWMLAHMLALLPFLLAFFVRGGKRVWVTNIVWAVLIFILPILAGMVYVEPGSGDTVTTTERNVAAFHPVLAVIVIAMTFYLAWQAVVLAAQGRTMPEAATAPRPPRAGSRVP